MAFHRERIKGNAEGMIVAVETGELEEKEEEEEMEEIGEMEEEEVMEEIGEMEEEEEEEGIEGVQGEAVNRNVWEKRKKNDCMGQVENFSWRWRYGV